MIYRVLLWAFLQVGLFTFGGGYASLPLMQQQAVGGGWMSLAEFTDMLAISQMTPGPVAINLATFVGLRAAGIPGAVVATVGYLLPSLIVVSVLAALYRRYGALRPVQNALAGLRPGVVGLILAASVSIVLAAVLGEGFFVPAALSGLAARLGAAGDAATATLSVNWAAAVLCAGAFVVLRRFKRTPPLLVIACCGGLGMGVYLFA
jgi:chromate transporter